MNFFFSFLNRYLQYCLLDEELLSMRKFETYLPVDIGERGVDKSKAVQAIKQRHMVRLSVVSLR